jgi:hypothetical protein
MDQPELGKSNQDESDTFARQARQKLKIVEGLFQFAYRVKLHQLHTQHHDWSHEQIHAATLDLIEKGCKLWEGFAVPLASPEDVIIKKLEYYKEGQSDKHLRDIRGILANTKLDMNYMNEWLKKLHLTDEWNLANQK